MGWRDGQWTPPFPPLAAAAAVGSRPYLTHATTINKTKKQVCAQMDELMEEQRDDNMTSMIASLNAGSRRR